MTLKEKIEFIVQQEKASNNSWKWIAFADVKTINDLYEYWTQEENPIEGIDTTDNCSSINKIEFDVMEHGLVKIKTKNKGE